MKAIIIYFFLLITTICCSNRNEENQYIGTWKLKQSLVSDGTSNPPTWQNVTNGYTIVFNNNGSFTTSQFTDCNAGNFSISNNIITLTYTCGNITIPNKFKIISNSDSELILSNINCDEECKDKFVKL